MKLLMENWREYQKQELLKEEVDRILFLLEEENEDLLKEAILNEGVVWDFLKNAAAFPAEQVKKVIDKVGDVLNAQLVKHKVPKTTRRNITKTLSAEKNKKLVVAVVFALIGLLMSYVAGPEILQFIESLQLPTVTQIYQAMDEAGDAKDWIVAAGALPIFGLASITKPLKDRGLGYQDSTITVT
jgi:hypothetical protein